MINKDWLASWLICILPVTSRRYARTSLTAPEEFEEDSLPVTTDSMATPRGSDVMNGDCHVEDETVRRADDGGEEEERRRAADTGCGDDDNEEGNPPPVHVETEADMVVDEADIAEKIVSFIRTEMDDDEGCVTDIEVSNFSRLSRVLCYVTYMHRVSFVCWVSGPGA